MSIDDRSALVALLDRMRAIHSELSVRHAGVCVLHLEAAIASLESHVRRDGVPMVDELRQRLSEPAAQHLRQ
jgi:hypothetical protein